MIKFTPHSHNLGFIPEFLSEHDPRPAVEQLNENYAHGGGWQRFNGFAMVNNGSSYALSYPGDPDMHEIARAQLREETIVVFDYAWVAVIQPDGNYKIARMD